MRAVMPITLGSQMRRLVFRVLVAAAFLGFCLLPGEAFADFQFKKGNFTKSTAGAPVSQSITGLGFQPKAVIFFWTRQTAAETFNPEIQTGYGFATGPANERSIALTSQDGVVDGNVGRGQWQSSSIVLFSDATPTVAAQAELTSFDAGGFTMNWTLNEARADIIHFVALGGSDITNTTVGSFSKGPSTGPLGVTGVGFKPDFVMFLSAHQTALDSTLEQGQLGLGFASSPTERATVAVQLEEWGPSTGPSRNTWVRQRADRVLVEMGDDGVPSTEFDFVSFDPLGFTVNRIVNINVDRPVHYLALQGGKYKVGRFNKSVAVAPVDQPVTGVGLPPAGVLLASKNLVTNAAVEPEGRISFGAGDGTTEGATWWHDTNTSTADANERTSTSKIAVHATSPATLNAEADLKSLDSNGFTLTWTTNNAVAHEMLYVAFGASPTVVSYSVGTSAANLRSSPSLTMTISGGTATFSEPQANNIGVGDKITYNGSTVAYISRRSSSTSYSVRTAVGATPPNVVGATVDSILRAFNSLTAANAGSADAAHLNLAGPPFDLVAGNFQLNWPSYNDGPMNDRPSVTGWTTGPVNYIRIYAPYLAAEVGARQRHSGVEATGFRLAPVSSSPAGGALLGIDEEYVRVDGIEVDGSGLTNAPALYGIYSANTLATTSDVRIDGCIVHDLHVTTGVTQFDVGIFINGAAGAGARAKISNNVIYDLTNTTYHVLGISVSSGTTSYVYSNTVYHIWQTWTGAPNGAAWGISARGGGVSSIVNATNNYAGDVFANVDVEFCYQAVGAGPPTLNQTTNVSSDTTGTPAGLHTKTAYATYFVNATVGSENLHLKDRANVLWGSFGTDLVGDPNLPVTLDTDLQSRHPAQPDHGADEFYAATAVELLSFEAAGREGAVELTWRTASELDNLGFHVYRGSSENSPWTRLTSSLIPGLGSSAVGQAYSFPDTGLTNGTRYFYRLDDVDASSKTTSHGPVSAVPSPAVPAGDGPGGGTGNGDAKKKGSASARCPDWVLAAYGASVGADAGTAALECTRHGDPEAVSLGVLSRDSRQATLELRTGGFYALHTQSGAGEPSGTVRVFVPGFDFSQDEKAAALPIRRALTDAAVGRRVQLGGVRALDLVSFKDLVPSSLGRAEMQVGKDGTVRAARRGAARAIRHFPKSELVRLLPSLFQGEKKSAVVEIAPLRFDARRGQLVLARRVLVRLLFTGREAGESGRGSLGRAPASRKPVSAEVLARLFTTSRGLYSVSFEQLFKERARGLAASELSLERQGKPVAFHLEPSADRFGPGSRLFFFADSVASSTAFSAEVAYELVRSRQGRQMPLVSVAPSGDAIATASIGTASFETNRFYQPGLLEALDLWHWEGLASGATRVKSFSLAGASPSGTSELDVFLQGASESGAAVDHHVSVSLNGRLVGEARFAGKKPYRISLSLPDSLLRQGANELELTNVADTGVTSFVFLDRFSLGYPQSASLSAGLFEGTWTESGPATVLAASAPLAVLDVTRTAIASALWLTGYDAAGGSLRLQVDSGHRYLVVAAEGLQSPRVALPQASTLRSGENQADYILVAPAAFLPGAEPLLARRADEGLTTRAVSLEEIADSFGHGRPSADAIKSFLAFAFHSWARPSPRYVLLLGDASYDPRNFTGSSPPSPLPALWARTSYLWTASDPQLAAVNGEDNIPDLAIGRLPASTVEQAQALVEKLLAWENSGQGLSGPATLVADNPDIAGDFEQDVEDIRSSYLASRETRVLKLSELGASTRPSILDALNSGLSFLNYVGHGGAAVWASENVWNSWDASSLLVQSRQPLLVTMNCLNGYFVAPAFESLSESLVKAEGRGAIAAFSPSGLSLDGPAHQYHRALMSELVSGAHERLGDAVLAAQKVYAQSGLMPELLGVYHLFGDPAMRTR